MNKILVAALAALAALAAAAPSAAQTPVQVPAFDSIELRGGGEVTVRHGARQSVTLVSGDTQVTRFSVDRDGDLTIDACRRTCRNYELKIEIVTPDVDAVAVHGGGIIRAVGRFPDRGALAIAIHGGGMIDMSPVEAGTVAAAINGGGAILTHARNSLVASVNGGGAIAYSGNPSVIPSIRGGGTIEPTGTR